MWLFLAACSGGRRAPSILLVTLDTTRADRLGCYGRSGAGTPALDALAARGARFERAYTTAPITLPAHASLLTGATPPHHGLRDNGIRALDPGIETLAEVARASGLRTGACVSGFPLDSLFGLDQGFEFYSDDFGPEHGGGGSRMRERRGAETVAAARAWLAQVAADEAFFLWVHLFDAHEPYQAPAEFAARFPADPYQAEIAYEDFVLAELLGALEADGRAADTLIVVTADHGEGLGEHGEETHALLLYDATMRVPLLLAGPLVPACVIGEPVSLVDVAPTLVELAGLSGADGLARHGGKSLMPLLRGEALPARELYLETLFPRLHFGWSELVGLVRADWKYVTAPGQERAELYRPAQDPHELAELGALEGAPVQELAQALIDLRLRLEANAFEGTSHAPSARELETLAALGYGGVDAEAEIPRASAAPEPGRDPRLVIAAVSLLNRAGGLASAGRFEEAARALDELAALDPGAIVLWEARGDFHLARARAGSREDLELAHAAFRQATELKPGRRGLWLRRSEACERLGLLAEALECVDRVLELAPPTPEFAAMREDLRRRAEAQGRR